jgi:hypothetical protein
MGINYINRPRRRSTVLVPVGAAVTGLLIAVLAQFVDAPTAHADDFSTVIDNIQAAETLGQADLSDAAGAYELGNFPTGLEDTFLGLDDTTITPADWLLQGGVAEATGGTLPASNLFDFDDVLFVPANYSDAVTEAGTLSGIGEGFLSSAADAFTAGDASTGVFDALTGTDLIAVVDPELIVLGLANSL